MDFCISTELKLDSRNMRKMIKQPLEPKKARFLHSPANPNRGHFMGTCRMGEDPTDWVTASACHVWVQKGLYLVDASEFPSSAGANPNLTLAANALRMARGIRNRMSQA